jgi:glutathione reductase (NADPH)
VPGIEYAITSNEIFDIPKMPKRILIVGGGYIASEFACIFNGLNVETSQYYRGEEILRGFDDEARAHISTEIARQGVNLQLGTDVKSIEKTDAGLVVADTKGNTNTFDVVMYATGRKPKTDGLGLENAGVELGKGGAISVDEYSQTNIPSIYAVGDVTNRIQLTPVAIREAVAFHETVFLGNPMKPDHANVASAIFTQPEYGAVGLSEEQAAAEGPVEIYAAAFRPMQNSFVDNDEKVLFKLVVCANKRTVLGCHIVAPGAGEMIQLAGVAVKMGATKEDFDATVAVHPTMSEEIVLMKTPARTHGVS